VFFKVDSIISESHSGVNAFPTESSRFRCMTRVTSLVRLRCDTADPLAAVIAVFGHHRVSDLSQLNRDRAM
jgi:hypothetical protein